MATGKQSKPKANPSDKKKEVKNAVNDRSTIYFSLILFVLSFILYGNTVLNEYCLDDSMFITENKTTQKGFAGVFEHFGQDHLYGFKNMKSKTAASGGWRPVSLMSFAMEVGFFGKNHPGISHFINVLILAGCVVVLYLFLLRHLFRNRWLSFFTAVIFTIHPIHSEVVANIKSRDALLCLLFLLFALHQFWRYMEGGKAKNLFLFILCFILSLMSKEDSITFVAIVPLMIWFFTDKKKNDLLKYLGYFFGATLLYALIRISIVPISGLKENPEIINNAFLYAKGMEAFCTKMYVLLIYLKILVLPFPLCFDYSYNQIPYQNMAQPLFWMSILIYTILLLVAFTGWKKKNTWSFIILGFLLSLFVFSNLLVDSGQMMAERFLFLPSIFFSMALAKLLLLLADRSKKKATFAIALLIPITSLSAYAVISRNQDWKNDMTLSLADVEKSPNSSRTNSAAGGAYIQQAISENDPAQKDRLLKSGINYLDRSLSIYPDNFDVLINMGIAWSESGSVEKARAYWEKVKAKSPNYPRLRQVYTATANRMLNKGLDFAGKNQPDSAIVYLQHAMEFSEYDPSLKINELYNLGGAYYAKGDYESAVKSLGEVLSMDSTYENAKVGYAASYDLLKRSGNKGN